MSEKQLLKLAESGDWKERAIRLLERKTNACLDVILSFVNDYWENLSPDEDNLHNFQVYNSEYDMVYEY